jgi:hypothetical protein
VADFAGQLIACNRFCFRAGTPKLDFARKPPYALSATRGFAARATWDLAPPAVQGSRGGFTINAFASSVPQHAVNARASDLEPLSNRRGP